MSFFNSKFSGNEVSQDTFKEKSRNLHMEHFYLDVGKEKQKLIVQELKNRLGMSWTEIAKFLGVTRCMTLFYNSGRYRLPHASFLKLCKKAGVGPKKFELKLIRAHNKPKIVALPKMSEDFAEFLGILYGDGCISRNWAIPITCDAISDRKYVLEKVKPLFEKLFKASPALSYQRNCIKCRLYSKKVHQYLSHFGFPEGLKKNRMHVPASIKKSKK